MFFQRVLKGINGMTEEEADMALYQGILCNWWRTVGVISPQETVQKLTEENLDWHLNHYDELDPSTNAPFSHNTPYISATAGSVERYIFLQRNVVFNPLITALRFATSDFTTTGHVFSAYVFTLGRESIKLCQFAEEVRELNIYKNFMPFHPEGEITAKIEIQPPQIEKWDKYDGPQVLADIRSRRFPVPSSTHWNARYAPPEEYSNIRGLVTD